MCIIVDDMISSGESLSGCGEGAEAQKGEKGLRMRDLRSVYGRTGTKFDEYYEKGLIDRDPDHQPGVPDAGASLPVRTTSTWT